MSLNGSNQLSAATVSQTRRDGDGRLFNMAHSGNALDTAM